MEPTTRQATKTKLGEQVLDLVIPYIHNVEDRNSVSLVSHNFYEIDRITRKRVTVHTLYYPNPASLSNKFPFIESLTLKGPPPEFNQWHNPDSPMIRPWLVQLALEFRCLKELHIRCLVVHDEDLETLARTRGKDLRSLKISKCIGFSADGLRHISKYCNRLRTLCLKYPDYFIVEDAIWLLQFSSNSTVLERLHITDTNISEEDLTLLAKNCCNSLISLKIGKCYLCKLGDAFRCAVRLEHFHGNIWDKESDLVGFQFPPNTRSLSIRGLLVREHTTVLPFLNQITKLKFVSFNSGYELLIKRCPNLEVLYTENVCRDWGLQVIGKFCKKLRKLTHNGSGHVTHVGLISLAKKCTKLECLKFKLVDISYEALECLGMHSKNLRKLCMTLDKIDGTTDLLPLENGIRAMLMGCNKLESLYISLNKGGLTGVGFGYIGKYGANLQSLTLAFTGKSNAGFVKLLEGCPRLRKLRLWGCPFSKQDVASYVFSIQSLRYVWFSGADNVHLKLTRPEFQLRNIGM